MRELIICGSIDATRSGEWFPAFNHYFCEEYLKPNFKLTYVNSDSSQSNGYYVQSIGRILRLNANNLAIINPQNQKVVLFTTYWNLEHLYENNPGLFNHHVIRCFSGHYNSAEISYLHDKLSLKNVFKPWTFRPLCWRKPSTEQYRPKLEKLFFNGLYIRECRDFIQILQDKNLDELDVVVSQDHQTKVPLKQYYDHACQYRLCLGASGVRDLCNRDIEFFKMGIPFIRPKFTAELQFSIPDDVYIPVECDIYGKSHPYHAGITSNPEQLAKRVLEKFKQVKDDHVLLNQVSQNAKKFYQENFTPDKIAQLTLKSFLSEDGFFD